MTDRIQAGGLQVATTLYRFVADEALPAAGTGLDESAFWQGVSDIVADLTPVNRTLLRQRDELQAAIDSWHRANAGQPHDAAKYRAFLDEIGYLAPDPGPFLGARLRLRLSLLRPRRPTRCAGRAGSRRTRPQWRRRRSAR